MSDALLGLSEPPADAKAIFQMMLDWANRIDGEGLREEAPASEPGEAGETLPLPHTGASAASASVRVDSALIEKLFRLSGESLIFNA